MKVLFGGLRYETCQAAQMFFHNCGIEYTYDIVTFENSFIAKNRNNFKKASVTVLPVGKKNALDWLYDHISHEGYSIFLSAGFPYILQERFFKLPVKFLNAHPHLLPEWPGYDVIRKSYLSGEKKYGITVHHMNAEVDAGKTIVKRGIHIDTKDIEVIYRTLFSFIEPAAVYEALSELYASEFLSEP